MYYEIVARGTDKRTKGHAKDVGTQIQMSEDDVQEILSQTDETRRSTTRRRKIHDIYKTEEIEFLLIAPHAGALLNLVSRRLQLVTQPGCIATR